MAFVVKRSGGGFAVFDGATPVSGVNSQAVAETIRDRLEREAAMPTKRRACLCCRATFDSQGPHNRLCKSCRQRVEPFPMLGGLRGRSGRRPTA
jgi:hypothetical protein